VMSPVVGTCNVEYRRHPEDLLVARPGGLSARNKETDG
jgi:hypothetical protein